MQILFIDDDMIFLKMADITYSREGDKILTEYNVLDALKLIEHEQIDLIICDYRMPLMTGLDVLAWLRERDYRIPFILNSSSVEEPVKLEALQKGALTVCDKMSSDTIKEILKLLRKDHKTVEA